MPIALLLLALALCAWAGIGYALYAVMDAGTELQTLSEVSTQTSAKQTTAARLHSIMRQSADDRAALNEFVSSDIVHLVDVVSATGDAAGVTFAISEASPDNKVAPPLSAVAVVASASGTFTKLVRAVALVQTIPAPVSLDQFELRHSSGTGNTWQLSMRLHLFAEADTTSP